MNQTLTNKSRNMIFTAMMVSSIIGSLLQTSLTTAIPTIIDSFHISASTAQWLTSAYSLAMGVMVPATPFLLKRFKTKRLFLTGMGMYFIGLLFSATSINFSMLLTGRIIQALGNGILLSMTQVVILTIFPPEKRGSAMGIYGLAIGVAPVLAPTITGIVIDIFDWHTIFWFALIIVTANIIFSSIYMKDVLENGKEHLDIKSLFLSTLGFSGLLIGLGNLGTNPLFSFPIILPLFLCIIMLILFVVRQLNLTIPFLELRTFKNREFKLSVIISILLYSIMIAGSILIPMYLQIVHGLSATISGLIMMPGSLSMAIISPFAGRIYDRFGIKNLVVTGSLFMVISCFGISFLSENTSVIYLSIMYVIRLIAISLMMMPIVTWGMSTMDSKFTSHGSAILTSLRTISGAISSAVFVAIMTYASKLSNTSSGSTVNVNGINASFISISFVALGLFIISIIFVKNNSSHNKKM